MTKAGALTVRNVWMEYPGQMVLERVNLALEPGAFCALVGASGCGKTTFLRMLLSIERPTKGSILGSFSSAMRCFRICASSTM